jgi:hypothetical protein
MIVKNIADKQKLVELFLKYRVGDIPTLRMRVQSNALGKGSPQWLWANLEDHLSLNTCLGNQHDIDGVNYAFLGSSWEDLYEGTFDLDTAPFQNVKPEVYQVGDTVEVLDTVKLDAIFYNLRSTIQERIKDMVGKTFKIQTTYDNDHSVFYEVNGRDLPHYAVRKIIDFNDIEKSESQEKITVELTSEEYNKLKKILQQ